MPRYIWQLRFQEIPNEDLISIRYFQRKQDALIWINTNFIRVAYSFDLYKLDKITGTKELYKNYSKDKLYSRNRREMKKYYKNGIDMTTKEFISKLNPDVFNDQSNHVVNVYKGTTKKDK